MFYTILHEGIHAWDFNNGIYHQYGYGNDIQAMGKYGYARAVTELRAYDAQIWFGDKLNRDDKSYYQRYKRIVGQNICHEIDYQKIFSSLQKKYKN